jgi:hypothetical protein
MKPSYSNSGPIYQESELLSILFHEIKTNKSIFPSQKLKLALEKFSREERRELVNKNFRNEVCPLFCAALNGNSMAAEYLITSCNADIEKKNLFEVRKKFLFNFLMTQFFYFDTQVEEEKTFHYSTPLWAASVQGHLNVVKLLVRLGANINSISDSGSTAVRSACFMSNLEVVRWLINAGADFNKPNYNGGTCLINSVQSIELCRFLLSKGVDVNAK